MYWLILSLTTLLIWGFWGFFSKNALNYLSWQQLTIISVSASIPVYLLIYLRYRPSIPWGSHGFYLALLIGVTSPIAMAFFYLALSLGKLSIVVPLTALYPIVTIPLSFFLLNEKITLTRGLGIIFAIIAIIFFSI